MAVRDLIFYPDPRLRLRADPVVAWDAALRSLAQDILDTMSAASAIGLTGPHIGRPVRVAVIRPEPGADHTVYVNPEIVEVASEREPQIEGSVSMPGVTEPVERPVRVRIRYRDLDGAPREETADGFQAACLLHEIEQLDGIFWIDRLTRLRRERALKRYAKLRQAATRLAAP